MKKGNVRKVRRRLEDANVHATEGGRAGRMKKVSAKIIFKRHNCLKMGSRSIKENKWRIRRLYCEKEVTGARCEDENMYLGEINYRLYV